MIPPHQSENDQVRSQYRQRTQEENAQTQEIILDMARSINPDGGYILVNELETRALFSGTSLVGKRVLEVGCGTLPVTMSIPCTEMPKIFVASDVNLRIVAAAVPLDSRPAYLVCCALDPSLRPGSIDCVVLNGVLHHLPPECNLLGSLQKLLTPDGCILILEPNTSCVPGELIKWFLRRFFHLVMEASPYGQFSRATIGALAERAGLRIEREWFASLFAFPLAGRNRYRVAPDSRWLFRLLTTLDEFLSRWIHRIPCLARYLHWRTLVCLRRQV